MATYTLSLDLKNSVKCAQCWSSAQRDAFNQALVAQFRPYYEQFAYGDDTSELAELLKFTGDGWLLIIPEETRLKKLAALGLAIVRRFQADMSILLTGIIADGEIPGMRAALCGGADQPIILPDGNGDYTGDSIRWAVRITADWPTGKLWINGAAQNLIHQDFATQRQLDSKREGKSEQAPDALYEVTNIQGEIARFYVELEKAADLAFAEKPRNNLDPSCALHIPDIGVIDFHFAWGGCDGVLRDPSLVRLVANANPWIPPKIVSNFLWRDTYDRAWKKYTTDPSGPGYYFRPLLRVRSAYAEGAMLTIKVQPTQFPLFAATCLQLEHGDFGKMVTGWIRTKDVLALQPFLASSLNVITTIVTSDNHLIIPRRGPAKYVYEKPNCLQASVGGHVEWGQSKTNLPPPDQHLRELLRETSDELGLVVDSSAVRYFGFGYNGITGEPDLLATINAPVSAADVGRLFKKRLDKKELEKVNTYNLGDDNELKALLTLLRDRGEWSQPSDRTAVVATLVQRGYLRMPN